MTKLSIRNQLPKAIIFDWDNTVIDTWPLIHEAIDETMVAMGKEPWGLKKVKENVHKSMRESFPVIFGDQWEKAGQIYKDSYKRNHLQNLVMVKDSMELINLAVELGITIFVVSNKGGVTLREEAQHLGLKEKFFSIIGAHDATYDKPNKEVVELALLGSDLDPENDLIWFIGDSYVDVECALNSGCKPVFFGEVDILSRDLIRRVKEITSEELLHFSNHKDVMEYLKNQ